MNTQFIIAPEHEGQRLDAYLAVAMDKSRSYIQNQLKAGHVLVSDKPAKASHKLEVGQAVSVAVVDATEPDILAENIPIDILYQDQDIAVVNKAKDMVVHPAPGNYTGTLVNALLHHCDHLSGINGVARPGIVHRIDKDTTGILVVAKNDHAHEHLAKQLAEHTVERTYHALVFGKLKEDSYTIDKPIGRNPRDRKQMAVTPTNSKPAVTHVSVLGRYAFQGTNYTYVKANLETGRTHQIRVHMAHLGHPVVGDTTYGYSKQPFKTNGQMLHAKSLGFTHPQGHAVQFDTDLPDYFQKILTTIAG